MIYRIGLCNQQHHVSVFPTHSAATYHDMLAYIRLSACQRMAASNTIATPSGGEDPDPADKMLAI